jgi:hypothetical protein
MGAAVRIAMTVAKLGRASGRLMTVVDESPGVDGEALVELREDMGWIQSNLRVGAVLGDA